MQQAPGDSIVAARQAPRKRIVSPASAEAPDAPKPLPRRRQTPWIRRVVVMAICVLLADALFGERGLAGTIRAGRDFQQASEGLRRLKTENAELRERARGLQEDPAAIEAVARHDLGLIRPGEVLVVIRDVR